MTKDLKRPKWWKIGIGVLSISFIHIAHEFAYRFFANKLYVALVADVGTYLILSFLFYALVSGSWSTTKINLKTDWHNIVQDKKGIKNAILIIFAFSLVLSLFLGFMAEKIAFSLTGLQTVLTSISYGVANYLLIKAFLRLVNELLPVGFSVILFSVLVAGLDFIVGGSSSISISLADVLFLSVVGYSILAKREGFSFAFATLFYVGVTCALLCACHRFIFAGFTFVTEPATGLQETMGLLFALLVGSMAYLAHYFYEYAYAYSLPMKEVVEKTKFAYQRTWGGKPLVIAELLPLLKKNRENIKVWTDAVITHEDYARSRTMSCNESYYGVHGFENGKWHCFDDGLLVHAETTSNREGRFRLNYNWPADRYLIKVIEKEKIYVGIFAVVKTLEEVQSYGKAYNFNAPPNVLSRWTKAPLNFRCQCALLYDISTGEEAYIRYDVIDHPDGFRRNIRGFYGGITLD
jgi:hypothetical protein